MYIYMYGSDQVSTIQPPLQITFWEKRRRKKKRKKKTKEKKCVIYFVHVCTSKKTF